VQARSHSPLSALNAQIATAKHCALGLATLLALQRSSQKKRLEDRTRTTPKASRFGGSKDRHTLARFQVTDNTNSQEISQSREAPFVQFFCAEVSGEKKSMAENKAVAFRSCRVSDWTTAMEGLPLDFRRPCWRWRTSCGFP